MSMKTTFTSQKPDAGGNALLMTMIMTGAALAILAGAMAWSSSSTRLTYRSIQYARSQAAAEAATEKVISQISQDFLSGGESSVVNDLNSYRNTVPTPSDSSYWNTWVFDDGNGNLNQTYVQAPASTNYVVLGSTYAGLQGYVSTCTVVSHARDTASVQDVTAGVLQQLQLVGIPIFQFYLFSSGNMEISCGQPFVGTGRVFSDGHLYIEPDASLTFDSSVSAVFDVLYQRDTADGDTRPPPAGLPAVFALTQPQQPTFPVPALTLPIGTASTPTAIREIIEPTPPGEDPSLPISKLRYNNRCDMVLTVSNSGVSATSGAFNNFATPILTNDLALFVFTNNSFWDAREGKTVQPIDIDIGNLAAWSQTNTSLRYSIGGSNLILSSVYVVDARTPPMLPAGNLGAVRVFHGTNLPPNGLTVATGRPLYVWGDYNELTSANLGTADTSATHPASLVADAITILSDAWLDQNQQTASLNGAASTTVNAALLTGVVETTQGQYSGGMENFPRFLESWGPIIFTYNGSMMKMFPSLYATNVWEGINYANHYYDPPARNWTYDTNFDDPTKLPPLTPSFQSVKRNQWITVAPNANVAATFP
jgi:hypothetical protein